MAGCTIVETAEQQSVGMGQILVARRPGRLTAVLGSCFGVSLFHPRLWLGSLAHVVLPESAGRSSTPGKFADTAIPHMITQLEELGANRSGLVARIAGGACMFGAGGPLQIGDANVEAVGRLLGQSGIRIVSRHVGGTKGRRITLDCATGNVLVQIAGCTSITI
ncbi:MAG: chemotaxis protein CheD [Pirellulales bacterium]|nr:chemotaxis protein CheD [Pirellulales bacterium]